METINEVLTYNLKRFRSSRTQAEIAEAAKIPFRTYQSMEAGRIPQRDNLTAIAKALGCQETELFLDPDLLGIKQGPLTVDDVISVLSGMSQILKVVEQNCPPECLEELEQARDACDRKAQ